MTYIIQWNKHEIVDVSCKFCTWLFHVNVPLHVLLERFHLSIHIRLKRPHNRYNDIIAERVLRSNDDQTTITSPRIRHKPPCRYAPVNNFHRYCRMDLEHTVGNDIYTTGTYVPHDIQNELLFFCFLSANLSILFQFVLCTFRCTIQCAEFSAFMKTSMF